MLENELLSISQREMTVSDYFTKVKSLCEEISKMDPENPISETRIKRIIVHGLRPEFNGLVTVRAVKWAGWVGHGSGWAGGLIGLGFYRGIYSLYYR
ncbi:hypothetical protein LINPERHAP2_LOCUS13606 [Linum perenne]